MKSTYRYIFLSRAIVTLITILSAYYLHAQQYLFAGSYNWDKNKTGLYVYEMDSIKGSLKQVSVVDGVLNPSFITVSPDGRYVYAGTETQTADAGSVTAFSFDAHSGKLAFINNQKSGGENPVYLSVNNTGKWLLDANYSQASISVYPLAEDGHIEAASQFIPFKDSSLDKERQNEAHIHSAVFSPKQDYVFFPDLGADKIRCFAFDPSKKEPLRPAAYPYTAITPGSGPRHFVFHPNGKYAYCIEEMGGYITVYTYSNGKLDSLQRIATHKHKLRAGYGSADIHFSPDGLFLYASNRGKENNIAIFSVDEKTGKLSNVGYQSVLGNHPRNFVIDPSGKFLLAANMISGNVVVFKRNAITGLLSATGTELKIPGVSCLQIRRY